MTAGLSCDVRFPDMAGERPVPAQRMTFAVPIPDSAAFTKDALLDEVLLPDRRLADGAVVVDTALPVHDPGMVHVTLDVFT